MNVFRITRPGATGTMTIREVAATRSPLDSFLYVYTSTTQPPTYDNDDGSGTKNSSVSISRDRRHAVFVKAAGFANSTGAYQLQFSTVFPGDLGPQDPALTAARDQSGRRRLDQPGST